MDMDGRGTRGKRPPRDAGRLAVGGRPQTRDRTLDAIQNAISNTRDSHANIRQAEGGPGGKLEQFRVLGWRESKAKSNPDGGVDSLIKFLERRMNTMTGPRAKITKVCVG